MAEQQPDTNVPDPLGLPPVSDRTGETALPEPTTQGNPTPPAASPPFPIEMDDAPTMISRGRPPSRADEAILSLRGRLLAHFELQEPVGVGGMGAVIKAHDTQLDRIVALKILPPHQAADSECVRRFQQEARAAAKLDHENIARAFYCGADQGLHFIAFEFVEGENLRTMLERRGRLPVSEAIQYLLQVAAGLAHAASRGVVHRDIKPSNIIVTPTGRAKLVDMGLARSTEPQVDPLTQSGVTLGTFDYISPEQALEPSSADVRSDIYSLGCTFYHMLTGQSPVPEGTVARKLHFHEHELPVDPRQLNPGIPDELAAVLAKMMAKDPKDRYQKSEHLVQHLLQLARKLGGAASMPEGMMFVDAPLLNPPRTRPALVGTLAAVFVVVLVVALGSIGSQSLQSEPDSPPWLTRPATRITDKNDGNPELVGPTVLPKEVAPKAQPPKPVVCHTVAELMEALKHPNVRITLAGERYELKPEDGSSEIPVLLFQGDELVLQGSDPRKPPVIHLGHRPISNPPAQWAALTVAGGKATVRGVRFEVHARQTETAMTAVVQKEGTTLILEDCQFVQAELPDEPDFRHVSSIQVAAGSSPGAAARPSLVVNRCYFHAGDQAVLVNSPANVYLVNCAFGPHSSIGHLRGGRAQDAELNLQFCSAVLPARAAAFIVSNGASGRLRVDDSLFASAVEFPASVADGAVLIRQTGDQDHGLRFQSQRRNVYYNLAAYWVRESSRGLRLLAGDFEDFKKQTWAVNVSPSSVDLKSSPWQTPGMLDLLAAQPAKAFLPNLELAELRQSDNIAKLVGVQTCTWGDLFVGSLPEPKKTDALARKIRIVNPQLTDSVNGIYRTIGQALEDVQPGDDIVIRHNGELAMTPVQTKPTVSVTIRPDTGYRPVLVVGQALDRDVALFRFHDGSLVFEDLRFLLKGGDAAFDKMAVVSVTGDGQVSFRRCQVTLDAGFTPAVVASLPSPAMVMQPAGQPPKEQAPQLFFRDSFIRGGGDLVWIRASRPCGIEVIDCLIALEGSLLVVDGTDPLPVRQSVQVNLERVTAYLDNHLVWLKGQMNELRPMPGLLPTQVSAKSCLFASAQKTDEGTTLVQVRGVDTEQQLKNLFTWQEGKENVYSNYRNLLEQQPRSEGMMPLAYDKEKWESFAMSLSNPRFEKVRFAAWPPPQQDKTLAQAMPADFRLKDPAGIVSGAAVEMIDKLFRDTPPSSQEGN